MTPDARLSAAIEILELIEAQRRPAADALKEWGTGHRFAGSKDRAALAGLVYDALRVRASAVWLMGETTARAILLGALRQARGMDAQAIAAACTGQGHAPAPLSEHESERLAKADPLADAPEHVRGEYPEWLAPDFAAAFGERAVEEWRALAQRAPLDLRVNTLKMTRDKAMAALAHLSPQVTPFSPWGLRIEVGADSRGPALSAEPAYVKGRVEVQDEGSQLAALLTGAQPGWQVLDLCAGGGGKTLALAAMMENRGQIYATDSDGRRLAASFERLERAGVRNVQIRAPRGEQEVVDDLESRCDLVLVDAPCTGTGAWRRNPDAKWRTRPGALEQRIAQQDRALTRAARFVKPGGALVYVTCSVLRAENEDRVVAFMAARPEFLPLDAGHLARRAGLPGLADQASRFGAGLRLSPLTTRTDGFYIASLLRS
ncbi:MAG TPA: RsmB/NOP family class I SAM-dependent RNA methyltransferase [Beijerinckiaceae bacterium]|nr:RsmB/NOP family class I SAM-dependent RNA methyltransferase [Beijerinckiaceae bacterium]